MKAFLLPPTPFSPPPGDAVPACSDSHTEAGAAGGEHLQLPLFPDLRGWEALGEPSPVSVTGPRGSPSPQVCLGHHV